MWSACCRRCHSSCRSRPTAPLGWAATSPPTPQTRHARPASAAMSRWPGGTTPAGCWIRGRPGRGGAGARFRQGLLTTLRRRDNAGGGGAVGRLGPVLRRVTAGRASAPPEKSTAVRRFGSDAATLEHALGSLAAPPTSCVSDGTCAGTFCEKRRPEGRRFGP